VLSTRIAIDHGTGRIYRAVVEPQWSGSYIVEVFDPDGNDLTPSPAVELHGIDFPADAWVTNIIRMAAINDTLSAIVRFHNLYSESEVSDIDMNWLKVLSADGNPIYLVGNGHIATMDVHRDAMGILVLTASKLRRYGLTGWPSVSANVQNAGRMAVVGNEVILGIPPSINRFHRSTLTGLAPIEVPSSGTAVSGTCLPNGSSAFNYAAVNGNGTMDIGLVDINSGLVWNNTITIPSGAEPKAYHVDEFGDMWISFAHYTAELADLGLIYRFHSSIGSYTVNSYSRCIDDITSIGSRLFLTGRVSGTEYSTYLAAFDTDLITGLPAPNTAAMSLYPNPANNTISIQDIDAGIDRISIIDPTGRSLIELTGSFKGVLRFSTADLAPGSYFIRLSGPEGNATLPLQVAR